jgi:phospholipid/cholesterol/gamma-HCH transport system permease protein
MHGAQSLSATSTPALARPEGLIEFLGRLTLESVRAVGSLALFFWEMLGWMLTRLPRRDVLLPNMYQVGIKSLPVVMLTGGFIGMVLAVQTYDQFRFMHLETNLGAVINISLVKELGPVLAATMLAGRVGSAMAAELGTMRVTEQIDALRALGANPIQYLVVPRFLSCLLLIPLLTIFSDAAGVLGGWFFGTQVLGISSQHYWNHTVDFVGAYELFSGAAKCMFFGAAISIIACHRGFHCDAGAEGVGKAATEAFVYSFVTILALDFLLGILLNALYPLF